MTVITGTLRFTGWLGTFTLIQSDGQAFNIWPAIVKAMAGMAEKRAEHKRERESYRLAVNPASDYKLVYEIGDNPLLLLADGGFGMSNVGLYLAEACQWLNGRVVAVTLTDDLIEIVATEQDADLDLKFTDGNSCAIPPEAIDRTCKPGTTEACAFLTCSADGFQCAKFSGSLAARLLDRIEKGTIRAQRIGTCRCVGREEREAAA